ncbi:WXG100 family type VII secretion target [Floccifex sp.]|uniref:WXG100 family type VII secretion target n=1 Tax=Floccifex sp. TaxID=2815810 RepID=UPI002A75B434|nr:WXG100 family type VII secretion target [Floccifex sp.]MDD7280860.1 WXG100 family type VII secretion target [Erysipelotrichaceae bacterium]MDY2958324.1 WXG100 family type VII secretion target [Floccifex sp.]
MLQIAYEDVIQYANQMNTLKQEMMDVFQDIQTKMNAISSTWDSPASRQFQSEFQQVVPAFSNFIQMMDGYVQFLSQTGDIYKENEEMLRSAMV